MPKTKPKIDKNVLIAVMGALGFIIAAYVTGQYTVRSQTEPIRMIIAATSTAEAEMTQAAYMAATATSVAQQNLGTYTISIPLAGAHTPPTSNGNVTVNTDVYKDLFYKVAIRIQIPTIGIDAPIVQGDGWEQLKKGVGQKLGTANPGESGFTVLSAHNDIYGEIFRYLDQLQQGDEIIIFTPNTQYSYYVESSKIVDSPNLELTYNPNKSVLVLTSSYPYLVDNKWIVVFAYLR